MDSSEMPDSTSVNSSTRFRGWMEHLISPRGDTPEWPFLMKELLTEEFVRERSRGHCYKNEVFIIRDNEDPSTATIPEKLAVRMLYHRCKVETRGLFIIGDESYLLLGYEWPNQAADRGRRADLVGINLRGGIAVFEAKIANNGYPISSLLEGLDYLACMTAKANFDKIVNVFQSWIHLPGKVLPNDFTNVAPTPSAQPEVIVLAPAGYYERSGRSGRGRGFDDFAATPDRPDAPVRLRFAECDFEGVLATWV